MKGWGGTVGILRHSGRVEQEVTHCFSWGRPNLRSIYMWWEGRGPGFDKCVCWKKNIAHRYISYRGFHVVLIKDPVIRWTRARMLCLTFFPRPRCSYLNCSWSCCMRQLLLVATCATQQRMHHSEWRHDKACTLQNGRITKLCLSEWPHRMWVANSTQAFIGWGD